MEKKQTRTLLFIGLGAGLLYFLSQRTLALIGYGSPSLRIHKVTFSEIEMRITLPIINQSDVPAPVSNFLGNLLYNGTSLGTLTLVDPVTLPGFGQTNIEFRLVSGLFGSAYEILNILTNGNPLNFKNIDYKNVNWNVFTIKGTLKVEKFPVPVNTTLF